MGAERRDGERTKVDGGMGLKRKSERSKAVKRSEVTDG